jgi:glycosyltransferase involved in cell wall biosynthesis
VSIQPSNVAVVHEWLVDRAGSEQVVEQILELYPDATLYVLLNRMPAVDLARFKCRKIVTSFLNRVPGAQRHLGACVPLMPLAVQQHDLSGHDLVISSNHCVSKGVIVPPEALHLCYCHSPMRYAWDLQAEYLRHEGLSTGLRSALARWLLFRLRIWDATSANSVDHFAANSSFVQKRILKSYRREAVVIHPPVSIEQPPGDEPPAGERSGYVTVGRIVGYKNVALMVEAFRLLPDERLTVVGEGEQLGALRRRAPPNVHFAGYVSQLEKRRLLRASRAFIFAAVEDFGIAPAEALAEGTPVIALARGGVLDYLSHGRNAWLFDTATPQALAQAVQESQGHWTATNEEDCRNSVLELSASRFRQQFAAWVEGHWNAWQQSLPRR